MFRGRHLRAPVFLLTALVAALASIGADASGLRRGEPRSDPAGPAHGSAAAPLTVSTGNAVSTFGRDAQHTAIFAPPTQGINRIRWSTPIDLDPGQPGHYGAPLTAALGAGSHLITATYSSDPTFASSAGSRTQLVEAPIFSAAGFSATPVVIGLNQPTAFAWTPDGRMLVLEKAGRVRILVNGVLLPTPALDISAGVDSGVEKGLLGICLDPGFATNGFVYLYYTDLVPENRISRFTMSGNSLLPASETVILDHIDATNGNHNGGTIAIGPDGKLWAAPGDSGTGGAKAQNLDVGSFSGKVLRMELNGSPAASNPFLADPTKEPRIWAYGFRNPFRFTFRPGNGSLYVADVGQNSREEIDVVIAGGNYGWPMAEGTLGGCSGCIPPVFEYDHSVGQTIIGGVFVTGGLYPEFLRGKYVFGDWMASWIGYLEFSAGDTLVGGLQNFASDAEGPVQFAMGPDQAIYFAAFNTGRIYRINPPPANFYTLTPCRVLDTRDPNGPWGGPALAAGADRTFVLAGRCGLPSSATAVSLNVTVTQPTAGPGFVTLYPAGTPLPISSTVNYRVGITRANNAILLLGEAGSVTVHCGQGGGTAHLIVDINGYFQ